MSTSDPKIHILGIGDDGVEGLTTRARQLVQRAELIFGAEHTLALVAEAPGEKIAVGADLEQIVRRIENDAGRRIAVLATGDPLFYGVARYLCNALGKDRFEVIPHVSSMQLAFARVKESWDEAYLTNLGSRSLEEVIDRIRVAEKVGMFTSDASPPSVVARELLDRQLDYFTTYVCENLGSPDERVTHAELADVANMEFAPLNVMILLRKPGVPDRPTKGHAHRLFGNPDELFVQSKPNRELLTPAEVRAVALAQLDLRPNSVVWDIGAGTGSVAIEAAQLVPTARVFAVEQNLEDYRLMLRNIERFRVANVHAVHGRAPDVLEEVPDPDGVFLGGIGRETGRLLDYALSRLTRGGRVVVNVGSIDQLAGAHEVLRRGTGDADVWMLQVARGTHQFEQVRFDAARISFLLGARK